MRNISQQAGALRPKPIDREASKATATNLERSTECSPSLSSVAGWVVADTLLVTAAIAGKAAADATLVVVD